MMHTTANITANIRFMIKFLNLINVAHPLEIVAQAVNESASSTKCARVCEASTFDRNGNTSTAISADGKLGMVDATPEFDASRASQCALLCRKTRNSLDLIVSSRAP
jgi:hypothetical protein